MIYLFVGILYIGLLIAVIANKVYLNLSARKNGGKLFYSKSALYGVFIIIIGIIEGIVNLYDFSYINIIVMFVCIYIGFKYIDGLIVLHKEVVVKGKKIEVNKIREIEFKRNGKEGLFRFKIRGSEEKYIVFKGEKKIKEVYDTLKEKGTKISKYV